jgi:hypothetical protein
MPSMLGIVRFVALLLIAAYVLVPDSRLGPIVIPAFFAFVVATVISMRKASQQFNLKGLKKLRDIFPKK